MPKPSPWRVDRNTEPAAPSYSSRCCRTKEKKRESKWRLVTTDGCSSNVANTYIDESKVVFINGKLFRSNLLFQGRGIGALTGEEQTILLDILKQSSHHIQAHKSIWVFYFLSICHSLSAHCSRFWHFQGLILHKVTSNEDDAWFL